MSGIYRATCSLIRHVLGQVTTAASVAAFTSGDPRVRQFAFGFLAVGAGLVLSARSCGNLPRALAGRCVKMIRPSSHGEEAVGERITGVKPILEL